MEALLGIIVFLFVLYIGHRSRKANDEFKTLSASEKKLKKESLKRVTPYSKYSKQVEAGSVTTIPDWVVVVGLFVVPIVLIVLGRLNDV